MCTLDIILNLLANSNKTQKELCEYLGIKKQAFTNWKNGNNTSYEKYLPKIAEFLDVSVDYLLGRDDNPRTISNPHIHTSITVPNLNNVSADISIIDIVEVKKLYQDTAVNKYLNNNWILLSIISESIDEQPNTNRCTFIIGRPKNVNR